MFLTSEKTNLYKLQTMPQTKIKRVKSVLNTVPGIYRKRLAGKKQAFLTKKEFETILDETDCLKLTRMLHILGFLTQTKMYLFWERKPPIEKDVLQP